jgi:alkylation response protein AidB-like acyl-CoA dehydrogenase
MDFSLTEEQEAVLEAATKLFGGHLDDTRRHQVEQAGDGIDRQLWAALAEANLLGLDVAEEDGGSGLTFAEVAVLLEEAGRAAAPVPLFASAVLGAEPIARFGTAEQRRRYLAPMVKGDLILTGALVEFGTEPEAPATAATQNQNGDDQNGDHWTLTGAKTCVPAGLLAGAIVVSADQGLFIVDPEGTGVTRTRLETTTGLPEAHLELDQAPAERLGGPEALEWLLPRATAGLCALMAGTCREAVRLTAEYAASRQQFGRYIATFQAVGQRAADAYIDAEAVALTARQAAWRLATDRPAAEHVAIAKFWAADGGQRVVHAAQHIHGGVGVDRSYPLHRYFLAAKQLELTLGGATKSLLRLGALMKE